MSTCQKGSDGMNPVGTGVKLTLNTSLSSSTKIYQCSVHCPSIEDYAETKIEMEHVPKENLCNFIDNHVKTQACSKINKVANCDGGKRNKKIQGHSRLMVQQETRILYLKLHSNSCSPGYTRLCGTK